MAISGHSRRKYEVLLYRSLSVLSVLGLWVMVGLWIRGDVGVIAAAVGSVMFFGTYLIGSYYAGGFP